MERPTLQELPPNQLLTLAQACAYFPSPRSQSQRISVKGIYRWCRIGYRGVKLKYEKGGHWILTTPRYLLEFMAAIQKVKPKPKTKKYWKLFQDAGISTTNEGAWHGS